MLFLITTKGSRRLSVFFYLPARLDEVNDYGVDDPFANPMVNVAVE